MLRLVGLFLQPRFQAGANVRPFGVEDAIDSEIANPAPRRDPIAAKNPLFSSADANQGAPRSVVFRIRPELRADKIHLLKRMPKHQILRFGIHARALPWNADPGKADLEPLVIGNDRMEPRRPDEPPRGEIDYDKKAAPCPRFGRRGPT